MLASRHALVADRSRRGISLLEVLISMFVTLFGLMYVFSLIPVGRHEMIEASKQERASCVAAAALRKMKIRGMLIPSSWCFAGSTSTNLYPANVYSTTGANVPYVIDPLGVSATGSTAAAALPFPGPSTATTQPSLRITLGPSLTAVNRRAMAEFVFRAEDDLLFSLPTNADQPAEQVYLPDDTNRHKRSSEGAYSWFATLMPTVPTPTTGASPPPAATRDRYTVSVAVYYRRNLVSDGAGERIADLKDIASPSTPAFPGGGIGGGEVTLQAPSTVTDRAAARELLTVKTGEWLMLFAPNPRALDQNGVIIGLGPVFKWYRVVGAESDTHGVNPSTPDAAPFIRQVTLSGPDWPYTNTTAVPDQQAWLFDGIIAVYEKTMRLETASAWNSY